MSFASTVGNTVPGLDSGYHSSDGPMTISVNPDSRTVSHAYVKACEEFGLKNGDYNGTRLYACGYRRCSSH